MTLDKQAQIAPATVASDLDFSDLRAAISEGWRDFCAFPLFGLFFAAIYVVAGIGLSYILLTQDHFAWLFPAAAGFPLLAPFTAVGLYEVSRRREAGLPMRWLAILGALRGRDDGQILTVGIMVFVAFSFWLMIAHSIFAIFMAESGMGSQSLEFLQSLSGIMMLLVGSLVGALMALAFFTVTVMSLPMLVDREVDFITAIIVSLASVRSNKVILLAWAVIIATSLFAAIIPLFLGLFVVLPVLGHATWHLYRRSVS